MGVEHRKICEIPSTTNKVISAHVDLPLIGNTRSAYANAFEFGARDFGAEKILSSRMRISGVVSYAAVSIT